AGGYSDMLAQRGEGVVARKAAEKPREAKAPKQKSASPKAKTMNFSDRHALKTLPTTIASLEKEIGQLQKTLSDGDAYARDPKRFRDTSAKLTAKQAELAQAEERWLEREMLREELEG